MNSEPETNPGTARRLLATGRSDTLLREEPLLLHYGESPVLTMRTPGDDEALAVGFALSEGLVSRPEDLGARQFEPGDPTDERPDTMRVEIRQELERTVRGRLTRTHEIRPSCGMCGAVSADAMLDDLPPLLPGIPAMESQTVDGLRKTFESSQPLFVQTGASHAAMLLTPDGTVLGHGEDVGRHNAVDKAIGRAILAGHSPDSLAEAVAFLSGRAGYELVLKCLRVRVAIVLSVSAPSALSFDLCAAAGATLVGFVRPGRAEVYLNNGRISDPETAPRES